MSNKDIVDWLRLLVATEENLEQRLLPLLDESNW